MLIDSVVIKLVRVGAGVNPDYTLTIYGNSTVIYEGRDNVKIKGDVEASISEGKIMELLSEFKDSGFFSLEDNYMTAGAHGKPHTIVSITMPTGTGNTITKKITHYHGDKNVPEQLKTLEDKIDEIAGTGKWIGEPSEFSLFKPKAQQTGELKTSSDEVSKKLATGKKKPVKLITVCLSIIIIIPLIFIAINFASQDSSIKKSVEYNDYLTPEITLSATASNISGFKDYTPESSFEPGDTIYVYCEYLNVSINENVGCDITIDLVFSVNDTVEYQDSFPEGEYKNFSKIVVSTDESWETGNYELKLTLTDLVSSKKASDTISFLLSEKNLVTTTLLPASDIRGLGDYDFQDEFTLGDQVYIYQEYSGFSIDNDNECDLYLQLHVIGNGITVYYNTSNVTDSSFQGHMWWFTPEESWPLTQYTVISYINDRISSESALKSTTFTLS